MRLLLLYLIFLVLGLEVEEGGIIAAGEGRFAVVAYEFPDAPIARQVGTVPYHVAFP